MRGPNTAGFSRISSPSIAKGGPTAREFWHKPGRRAVPRPSLHQVLGRFHEISLQTADIRESVEFYERLGFTQASANDTWTHPYGVLTDGRVFIGLHQRRFPSPALTFVHAGVAEFANTLEGRGIELETRHTSEESFNEIAFRDPDGQSVLVLEARTYSPPTRSADETSLCGYFTEISMPSADFERAREF